MNTIDITNEKELRKYIRNKLESLLIEVDDTDIEVDRSINQVKAVLKSHKGSHATKLAREYEKIHSEKKKLEKEEKKIKNKVRDYANELLSDYSESKEILDRRVIETSSVILKVGKQSKRTYTRVDVEGLFEELAELTPQLTDKLDDLKDKYVKVSKSVRRGTITTDTKNEGKITDFFKKIFDKVKELGKAFLNRIKSWSNQYDRELEYIKKDYNIQ